MDLDDEELKATRRMNGSDKNVGSIEKDVERCEQLTKPEHANWIGLSNQHALEHLIKAYKELKQENRKLSKANERYIKSIQNITPVLMNDYIEKTFVEEKLGKLTEQYKIALEENSTKAFILKCQIGILQELLEGE